MAFSGFFAHLLQNPLSYYFDSKKPVIILAACIEFIIVESQIRYSELIIHLQA